MVVVTVLEWMWVCFGVSAGFIALHMKVVEVVSWSGGTVPWRLLIWSAGMAEQIVMGSDIAGIWWLSGGCISWGVWLLPSLWRCDVLGWCGGVWGQPSVSKIILINFKTPDPTFPPIFPKNVCTYFTEGSSIYSASYIIPNLNSSPNLCATHFPNHPQYLL